MTTGTVKWFNDAKGFGLIVPDEGGEELPVHYSEIRVDGFKSLDENQQVQFEVKTGPKGQQAVNVVPL
ncbi:cold-shock protein [Streptomyces sp. NBC_01483]|uniref:cold-shock protein n=1 Tax=Streptomyces sp. NBC_01483 TaxID=2903883 RepID=UPI002E2FB66E|nr:cold-shock protein [Streptomyces sp. NBC_01483]